MDDKDATERFRKIITEALSGRSDEEVKTWHGVLIHVLIPAMKIAMDVGVGPKEGLDPRGTWLAVLTFEYMHRSVIRETLGLSSDDQRELMQTAKVVGKAMIEMAESEVEKATQEGADPFSGIWFEQARGDA